MEVESSIVTRGEEQTWLLEKRHSEMVQQEQDIAGSALQAQASVAIQHLGDIAGQEPTR